MLLKYVTLRNAVNSHFDVTIFIGLRFSKYIPDYCGKFWLLNWCCPYAKLIKSSCTYILKNVWLIIDIFKRYFQKTFSRYFCELSHFFVLFVWQYFLGLVLHLLNKDLSKVSLIYSFECHSFIKYCPLHVCQLY